MEAREFYAARKYRPTVVAVVESRRGLLLVQSKKDEGAWHFPQGGTGRVRLSDKVIWTPHGETVLEALYREVQEEVGLIIDRSSVEGFLGTYRVDIVESRSDRRGYEKGKAYFVFKVRFPGAPLRLVINENELADYAWAKDLRGVEQLTASVLSPKRELTLRWAELALNPPSNVHVLRPRVRK